MDQNQIDCVLRVGDIQLVLFWVGPSNKASLRAIIQRVVSPEVQNEIPSAVHTFRLEELPTLALLVDEATKRGLRIQSTDVAAIREEVAKAKAAEEEEEFREMHKGQ